MIRHVRRHLVRPPLCCPNQRAANGIAMMMLTNNDADGGDGNRTQDSVDVIVVVINEGDNE